MIDSIRRASKHYGCGEIALALVHLARAGLGTLADRKAAAYRLFIADALLADGLAARDLLKACDLDPSLLDRLGKASNPDEPRIPAGNGCESGEWTIDYVPAVSGSGNRNSEEEAHDYGLGITPVADPAKGFLACVGEITNSGIVILLDHSKRCDANYFESPGFVNADYNAAEIGNTAATLAAAECRWRNAKDIVWLHGTRISGREAAGCRRSFPDGHIEVTFIVLRKTDESPLAWIEISADLITTPPRYAADMRVFRRVLPGIWVHPDGPYD